MATTVPERSAEAVMTTVGPRRRARRDLVGLALLVAAIVVFPLVAGGQPTFVGVYAGMYALAALGLSLLMGLAGQISLGQAGFLAIGAYTSAVLTTRYGVNALLAAVVAVAITVVAAFAVGIPILRLRGHYLALATLGFGIIVAVVANQWEFLGGQSGIFGVGDVAFNGRTYDEAGEQFYLLWAVVVVALVLARNLADGRIGRALGAVNDSEVAAETLGIDTFRLRLQVFVLSAALAAIAGTGYAHVVGVVNAQAASFQLSVELLLMAVVGGLASVWGAVIGAVFVEFLGEGMTAWIPRLIPGASGEYQLIGFGLVLVLTVIFLPGGFVQAGRALARRLGRREALAPEPAEPATRPPREEVAALLPREGRPGVGTPVLRVEGLTRHFGGVRAVDGVDLEVRTGEIVALIGPNGAGKTTLFNVVSGVLPPSAGTVEVGGRRVEGRRPHDVAAAGAARTFQNLQIFSSMTVAGNVAVGRHLRSRAGILAGAVALPARGEERAIDAEARRLAGLLGLDDVADVRAADLPFGRQRLVEVARALATEPDLLLLDEPMAGLSAAERADLAQLLRRLRAGGMAILLVEHDMEAVMALADRVAVLDDGRRIAEGPPARIADDPVVIAAYLGTDEDTPAAPPTAPGTADGTAGPGPTATVDSTATPRGAGEAGRPGAGPTDRGPGAPVSGGEARLAVGGLVAGYGRIVVLHELSLSVQPGELLAVVGANGAGKTTLLRVVSGLLPARAGRVRLDGEDVTGRAAERLAGAGIAHVPENRLVFPGMSVADNLALGAYGRRGQRSDEDLDLVLDLFPRLRDRQGQSAGTLSGGEQQMLAIGRGLMARPRLLLLDEPSLGLAPKLVTEIFAVLARLRDRGDLAVVLVEQNARAAFRIADRAVVLDRGRILLEGTPDELLTDPRVQAAYLGRGYTTVGS